MSVVDSRHDEVELAMQLALAHISRTNCRSEDFSQIVQHALDAVRGLIEQSSARGVLNDPQNSKKDQPVAAAQTSTAAPALRKLAHAPLQLVSNPDDAASGYVRQGRRTVFDDRIICLDDNREVTFLRRHLRRRGIDELAYLHKYELPADYPMTAPAYVRRKQALARESGFGVSMRPDREQRDTKAR